MKSDKFIGSVFMVIGTIIGAGMFALPLVGVSAGFALTAVLIFAMWIIASLSGLLILEVNLALPAQNASFSSMAEKTFGSFGKVLVWLATIFLLYSMLVAYVIGETDVLVNYFSSIGYQISRPLIAVAFTTILGAAVFWSTSAADYFNRFLLSFKAFFIIAALMLILPRATTVNLFGGHTLAHANFLWLAVPSFLGAFCYQFVIPSLRLYVGDQPKQLKTAILIGTGVAAVVYVLWLAAVFGVVPLEGENSFMTLASIPGASVGTFSQMLITILRNPWIARIFNGFTIIAMTTSFIGVSLSLFDFLADGLKRSNSRFGRLQTAILTFVPPLLFAIFYPNGFVIALNYASIPVACLCIILPSAMAYRLRHSATLHSSYRVTGGNTTLLFVAIGGIICAVTAILYIADLLPGLRIG